MTKSRSGALAKPIDETSPRRTIKRRRSGEQGARVATVLRLEPHTRDGLEFLQASLGTTMNKLMNDALAEYVAQRTAALEREVQASLDRIKRHRRTDPSFSKELARVAEAEARYAKDDPVSGSFFIEEDVAGPTLSAVRKVIHGR